MDIDHLERCIRQCRICIEKPDQKPLPHEPRPVAVLSGKARLMIIGQAPGTRVHVSGRPFTDPSGDRLRNWMGIDESIFYNPDKIAIAPMGFCFPGLDEKGGDLPPRKECAREWQAKVLEAMPQIELILLIGMYAQKHHLKSLASKTLTQTVQSWRSIFQQNSADEANTSPRFLPLPHPSWRNNAWIRKNPWFSDELLPVLRKEVAELV